MDVQKRQCANLMRVGKYFPGLLGQGEGDPRWGSAQYLCVKTGNPVGPDSNVAEPEECSMNRSCYQTESHFAG